MNSELKKGQLVAVWDRDDCAKSIRIFVSTMQAGNRGELFECRLPDDATGILPVELWEHCVPLEEVEPGAFIGRERHAREQDRAVEMESELVQRLRRQVRWLAQRLANNMPPETDCSGCFGWFPNSPHREDGRCAICWEEASLKAVEGKTCPQ